MRKRPLPTPLKTKKSGYELCRGCHSTMVNKMFAKNRVHWPTLGKEGCLSCHNPHASKQNRLLKGEMLITMCGRCHQDTIRRQEKSADQARADTRPASAPPVTTPMLPITSICSKQASHHRPLRNLSRLAEAFDPSDGGQGPRPAEQESFRAVPFLSPGSRHRIQAFYSVSDHQRSVRAVPRAIQEVIIMIATCNSEPFS